MMLESLLLLYDDLGQLFLGNFVRDVFHLVTIVVTHLTHVFAVIADNCHVLAPLFRLVLLLLDPCLYHGN